jgi:hypothetical protein
MLIPEAAQLVLQAAVFAHERATFVLDMGEQIKVLDVARNLIRLSGFVPDEEIPITIIGLRPGEKLFEELVGKGEELEPAGMEKIFRVRDTPDFDRDLLAAQIGALIGAASIGRAKDVLQHLRRIVPSFNPDVVLAPVSPEPSPDGSRRRTVLPVNAGPDSLPTYGEAMAGARATPSRGTAGRSASPSFSDPESWSPPASVS